MDALANKRILFCRDRDRSAEFARALEESGAVVQFVPVSQTRFVAIEQHPETVPVLRRLSSFDALIFSSENGLAAFVAALQALDLPADILRKQPLAVVGEKTARQLRERAPAAQIVARAATLQALIDHLAAGSHRQKLLHLTSAQSLENIALQLPPHVDLYRLPLYETIPNPQLPVAARAALHSEWDAIIFSSPSSFDHFVHLCGEDRRWENAARVAFGPTTRAHIEQRGYSVALTPEAPSPAAIRDGLLTYFQQFKSEENNVS